MSNAPVPPKPASPKILIVIVRYKTPLEESAVMQSLAECFAGDRTLQEDFAALIWDNSPAKQAALAFPFICEYRHTGENVGVSGAYIYATRLAQERGDTWLLLLDQDTVLPLDFLSRMREHARRLESDATVAAVAPTVLMNTTRVSPKITTRWGQSVDPSPGFEGIVRREMILMNSGLLIRVSALKRVGGYSMDFWLDFSDRYVCYMLAQHGYSAWLAGEIKLDHHVSLMSGEGGTSVVRYANLMGAQDAYFSMYKSLPRNIVFCLRLLRNAVQERNVHPERTRLLRQILIRRVTVSRKRRIAEWRRSVAASRSSMASQA